ncbi:hypothetical protein JCM1841_006655 [Sporobolomyces salmonicolor]
MSSSAKAVSPFSNAHRQYVQHLYRRALKGAQDWYVRSDLWRNKAIEIRAQFERNRNVRDPRAVAALLNEAEKEVQRLAHPDPYRRSATSPYASHLRPSISSSTSPPSPAVPWQLRQKMTLTPFFLQPRMFTQAEKDAALNAH